MTARLPDATLLHRTVDALRNAGITVTLGGSGLLVAHGILDTARDWDLTTDADPDEVRAALARAGIAFTGGLGDTKSYATRWRYLIDAGDHDIDLMVGFAIRREPVAVAIPTIVSGAWGIVPLGSLEAWLVAYRLMDRPNRPAPIAAHLKRHGANPAAVARLLQEPLPDAIRDELQALPVAVHGSSS